MALVIRGTFYRLEQLPGRTPNFALSISPVKTLQTSAVRFVDPVNVLGAASLGNFGFLYSKVTMTQAGLEQELYALQTVQQLQQQMNA